jgi:alanyl-tRNA synthetase
MDIQDTANRIIMSAKNIKKGLMPKGDAELEHGFSLYQGGIVPGNELRVVNIEGTDVEACCGTHCDNTSEVGWVKIIAAKRIADGIVRLYFVAGERSIVQLNEETKIIN